MKKSLKNLLQRDETHFVLMFLGAFLVTFSLLFIFGLIPKEFRVADQVAITDKVEQRVIENVGLADVPVVVPDNVSAATTTKNNGAEVANQTKSQIPLKIKSPAIGLDFKIVNPKSTDYTTLDNALMQGAVRYPTSGTVQGGNMFIFGHSTSFQAVNNKSYQVFNNIHTLKNNDEIYIETSNKKYVYKVTSVELVDGREELVSFSSKSHMLTLSTCDSFGAKTSRYVVKALFDRAIDI